MTEPKTVSALVNLGDRVLSDSTHIFEDHDNQREAEELMAFALGIQPEDLDDDTVLARRQRERYLALIARRAAGEPFPLLTGSIEFYGLDLQVRAGYFIPRPSSELTVTRAVRKLRQREKPLVLDVCTGSGPIALAVANELPEAQVWATDIDARGLIFGRRNA